MRANQRMCIQGRFIISAVSRERILLSVGVEMKKLAVSYLHAIAGVVGGDSKGAPRPARRRAVVPVHEG